MKSSADSISVPDLAPLARSQTLSHRTADLIRSAIVDGRLTAGSHMTVAAVAKICGVSATPAREALIRLSEVGLLTFGPNGITVVESTRRALQDAFELREPLEGMAARLAAVRATEPQRRAITELAAASVEAAADGNAELFRSLDIRFHLEVAAAAQSAHLERSLRNSLDLVHTLRGLTRVSAKAGLAYMHDDIAVAIGNADPEGSERLMRDHVSSALRQFLENNPL